MSVSAAPDPANLARRVRHLEQELAQMQATIRQVVRQASPTEVSSPLQPPPEPGGPTLTTKLGTVTVTNVATVAPEVDHTDVYASVESMADTTQAAYRGSMVAPGGTLIVGNLSVGTTYYVRLVHVARSGERGEPSAETPIVVAGVEGPDLAANSVATNHLQAGAVTAEKVDADAVNGKTITGALIRTDVTGSRLELNGLDDLNALFLYSGHASELFPGEVSTITGANYSRTGFTSPLMSVSAQTARIYLTQYDDGTNSEVHLDAEDVFTLCPIRNLVDGYWHVPTLGNSWLEYDAAEPVGFHLDAAGQVHFRGRVKSGTVGAALFTLPGPTEFTVSTGFRPSHLRVLHAPIANGGTARVEITAAGVVTIQTGGADAQTWTSLSALTFAAR